MAAIGDLTFVWTLLTPVAVAWLLTFAIHSTLLLSMVWLVSRCVRSHRLKDVFWKTALVGGVLTATLQVALGLQPLAGRFDLSPSPTSATGTVPQAQGSSDAGAALGQEATQPSASTALLGSNAGTQTMRRDVTLLRDRLAAMLWGGAGWLFGLWLLGAAVAGLRFGLATRRLCASLGCRRDVADGPLTDMLAHLRRIAGVRYAVRLTYSPNASGPLLVKAREICLPQRAITRLGAEQQKSLLAHELAHVVRRDPIWLTAIGVLECLFFFQPLFRLSRRAMHECAEYLCDDLAARYVDGGLDLARCLVEVAGWLPSHTRLATVASMAENASNLERRIRRLLDGSWSRRPETLRWWWAIIVVGVLALVGVAGPGVSAKAGSALPASASSVDGRSIEQDSPWEVVAEDKSVIECDPSEVRAWIDGAAILVFTGECESTPAVLPLPKSGFLVFASFVDIQTGWVASSQQPSLWATSDGAKTWTAITLPAGMQDVAAIQLRTARDGYLLSTTGVLYVTRDGGASWSSQVLELSGEGMFIPKVAPSAALYFDDDDHGLVVVTLVGGGRGEVLALRTADGGLTWTRESVPVEPGTLYLVNRGTILGVESLRGQFILLRYREP